MIKSKEDEIKILIWYGYKNPKFAVSKNNVNYYRCDNWVIGISHDNNGITLQSAREDFYQYYPIEFYDFEFETTFNHDEIKEVVK